MKYEDIIRKVFPHYLSKRELIKEREFYPVKIVPLERDVITYAFEQTFEPISAEMLDDKSKRRLVLETIDRDTFIDFAEWHSTMFPDGREKVRGKIKVIRPRSRNDG